MGDSKQEALHTILAKHYEKWRHENHLVLPDISYAAQTSAQVGITKSPHQPSEFQKNHTGAKFIMTIELPKWGTFSSEEWVPWFSVVS